MLTPPAGAPDGRVCGADRPVVFLSGKGGVGKTTLATALALVLAERGERVLLVSTDPAHSTTDLLGVPLGPEPTAVAESWWAMELDAEREALAHVERIKKDAAASVSPDVLPAVERHLDLAAQSPGTVESALVDRLADVLAWYPERFDRIVVDTAPTGHTLRLLALPSLLTAWVEGLVRRRERVAGTERWARNLAGEDGPVSDPVLDRLRARRDRLDAARRRLLSDAVFHLVLVPERLPVAETARALEVLDEARLTVGVLLVNRVLPPADGEFMRGRLAAQAERLEELRTRLPGRALVQVEHLPGDVTTRDEVRRLADVLVAAGL